MATISHPAFRILIEQFGQCDEYFTEMINAGTLMTGGQFEKFYIDPTPVPEKVVWQLTGHDTENMGKAAAELIKLPGIGLDINMGCSAPDIYRYGAGIAWMLKDISETEEMLQEVASKVRKHNQETGENKRLSVKLRLGDDNFTDNQFYAFTDMLVKNGVQLLTLHPRTKKEKLARPARYHYCEDLALRYENQVKVNLNGNIKDSASAAAVSKLCPHVDGIMISRAAVTKPWIFAVIKKELEGIEPSESDLLKKDEKGWCVDLKTLAHNYIYDIEKYQPQEFWKTRLQRFFTYYSDNFLFSHYAQTQFLNSTGNEDLHNRIEEFFEKCPDEKLKYIII